MSTKSINSYDELEDFIFDHYKLETNFSCQDLDVILQEAEVILVGETHHDRQHAEWNGKLINAIWTPETQLFVEHESMGAKGQLIDVDPSIAKSALQWDFTKSKTAAIFDQLVALSALIKDDFREISFTGPQATKQLLKQGEKLIEHYLVSLNSIENASQILDHSVARILDAIQFGDVSEKKLALMYKQAYLRLWVHAAIETMERFEQCLEEELEERNGWMVKNIEKALRHRKRVILIAGSEHFSKTIRNSENELIQNPVLSFLRAHKKKCLILEPLAEEIVHEIDITHISHLDLEKEINHLSEELSRRFSKKSQREIEGLMNFCVDMIEHASVETHKEALQAPYMTGSICVRVDRLTKTIQIWNVIAELALAQDKWLDDCEQILRVA